MIITRTPFRISFFGGGTDYPEWFEEHGGAVLATTIDKYCYVMLHNGKIYHTFDLPTKSGLGTSSAYTVGLLRACTNFDNEMIAKIAIEWERDKTGGNVGYQDQYLCSLGGFHLLHFFEGGMVDSPVIDVAELNNYLMLFDTHQRRMGGDLIAHQLKRIRQNEKALIRMGEMAKEGTGLLSLRNYTAFGELLNEAWTLKKSLDRRVSSPSVDSIYEEAIKAGAIGGKLLGAGGGGFVLLFVPPDNQETVKETLKELTYVPFKFESEGSRVIYNEGTN